MKNILIASLALLLFGCSCTKEKIEPEPTSFLEVTIDNQTVKIGASNTPSESFTMNESCNYLYASSHYEDEKLNFYTKFTLTKDGYIKDFLLADFKDNNTNYKQVDFNILDAFQLQNFSYDKSKGSLYFEFEGDVYLDYDPDRPQRKKHLKGKVKYENLPSLPCSFFPDELASVTPTSLLRINNKIVRSDGNKFEYWYFTDNGYMLIIHNLHKINAIPVGTYTYNSSKSLKITLRKYIGIVKSSTLLGLKDEEWLHYDCEGELNIAQHQTNPFEHTIGSFSLRAKDKDGAVVHELPQVSFKIAPW